MTINLPGHVQAVGLSPTCEIISMTVFNGSSLIIQFQLGEMLRLEDQCCLPSCHRKVRRKLKAQGPSTGDDDGTLAM